MRHRVFARYLGRVAFVNVFPGRDLAAKLVMQLRQRYGPLSAEFWHADGDQKTSVSWQLLRALLRQREPMKIVQARGMGILGRGSVAAVTDRQIDDYLAGGGAITLLPTRHAANPPLKKIAKQRKRRRAARR